MPKRVAPRGREPRSGRDGLDAYLSSVDVSSVAHAQNYDLISFKIKYDTIVTNAKSV